MGIGGLVGAAYLLGYLDLPGDQPDQSDGLSICHLPAVDGSPSCLVITDLVFDPVSGFFSMDFEFKEPVCPNCTGNIGRLDILLNGNIAWRSFGPGNYTLTTTNINTDAAGNFGLLEFWISDDRTKGVNRIYVNASGGILTISDQFASGELP